MCPAFHAAGVHQQVGTLDALQCLRVWQSTQLAVMRTLRLCVLCGLAQSRIQRGTNVVNEDASAFG